MFIVVNISNRDGSVNAGAFHQVEHAAEPAPGTGYFLQCPQWQKTDHQDNDQPAALQTGDSRNPIKYQVVLKQVEKNDI